MKKKKITKNELIKTQQIITKLDKHYKSKIIGQDNLKISLFISLIANGHILLESMPGLAKTTSAKTITEAFNGSFSRIQATPDILPTDIIGTQIYNNVNNSFETRLGPIFANFILIDEINRSNPKSQSATLEAMQEKQVTIDKETYYLPKIFTVIATINPIEQEGTYQLAEAQLDRFLLKEKITYPTLEEELKIINKIEQNKYSEIKSTLTLSDLEYLQEISERVYIDESIKIYIIKIIDATRNPHKYIEKSYADYIELGASPRATIAFIKCSKALALLNNRDYVIPDDIIKLKYNVLAHRIKLSFYAISENITEEMIIDKIFDSIQV